MQMINIMLYNMTGIIAEDGLSKNDLLLKNIKGKKEVNKFIIMFIIVFVFFFFILNISVKQALEKNREILEVNIRIKNHINTVKFSILFINLITCIYFY